MNQKVFRFSLAVGLGSIVMAFVLRFECLLAVTREHGIIENTSAFLYVACFIFCFASLLRGNRSVAIWLWLVLSILFLGEETSWFQSFLGYSVPAVESLNSQGEFNIHNLAFFQGGSLLDGQFHWTSLLKSQNLFRLGFYGYFLVLPVLSLPKSMNKILESLGYFSPGVLFSISVLVVFSFSLLSAFFSPPELNSPLAEIRELLYAFYIALYAYICLSPFYEEAVSSLRN